MAGSPEASSASTAPSRVDHDGGLDLRGDLGQVGESGRGIHGSDDTHGVRRPFAQPLAKFFADRGPHLAAMIAYFGLLSSVSLIFLALAVLGWTGRAEESSYFVEALDHLFPSQSIENIVKVVQEIRENATALGVIGVSFLLWTSLSLFSVLESAFNIVYGRPNRSFLRGKFLATLFMAGSIIALATGLVIGGFGYDLLQRFARGAIGNGFVAYCLSAFVSTLSVFIFLVLAYERLTNVPLSLLEVWPGAAARRGAAPADVPDPAALRPPLERGGGGAGARHVRAAARLDLRDGERDRLRRRGELVVRPPRRGGRRRPGLVRCGH